MHALCYIYMYILCVYINECVFVNVLCHVWKPIGPFVCVRSYRVHTWLWFKVADTSNGHVFCVQWQIPFAQIRIYAYKIKYLYMPPAKSDLWRKSSKESLKIIFFLQHNLNSIRSVNETHHQNRKFLYFRKKKMSASSIISGGNFNLLYILIPNVISIKLSKDHPECASAVLKNYMWLFN